MDLFHIILLVTTLIIMAIGLVGIILPTLPGIILIWTGIFFYAAMTHFNVLNRDFVLFVTSLTLFAIILDYLESVLGSHSLRDRMRGLIGGLAGGLVALAFGSIALSIAGIIAGALIGQLFSGKDPILTVETRDYKVIIYMGATLIQVTIGIIIIEMFLLRVL